MKTCEKCIFFDIPSGFDEIGCCTHNNSPLFLKWLLRHNESCDLFAIKSVPNNNELKEDNNENL